MMYTRSALNLIEELKAATAGQTRSKSQALLLLISEDETFVLSGHHAVLSFQVLPSHPSIPASPAAS